MDKQLCIQIFQVGCGDAISIQFVGADGKQHCIMIDGGFQNTYKRTLKRAIPKLKPIAIWLLTHVDQDHIMGALEFFKDPDFKPQEIVQEVWCNHADKIKIEDSSPEISLKQVLRLKQKLDKLGIPIKNDCVNTLPPMNFKGSKITFLSPDAKGLKEFKAEWQTKLSHDISGEIEDYSRSIEDLNKLKDKPEKKSEIANRSSIAFLFEYEGIKILFLGDAHSSVIVAALRKLGYSETNRLKVAYMKVAHHGSKANYQSALLDLVDCDQFIISANYGNAYNLPNKAVLAKILCHPKRDASKRITFIFNDREFKTVFAKEQDTYNFKCCSPKDGKISIPLKV